MNTTNPGIFIPLIHSLSELVYIDSPAEYQKLFAAAQEKISAALQEISVEHFVFPACRICLDDKTGQPDFYQGLSVFLRRPHQIEYVKAMPAIKKALAYPDIFAEDAYTVPLQNVPAPGFGQIRFLPGKRNRLAEHVQNTSHPAGKSVKTALRLQRP